MDERAMPAWPAPRAALPLVAVAFALAVAMVAWRGDDAASRAVAVPAPAAVPVAAPAPAAPDGTGTRIEVVPVTHAQTTGVPPRSTLEASSLRGAAPDGVVALDDAGRLVVDRALRRRFDWYLTLAGETDHASLRALFARDVEASHGVAVAAEALAWFDRYVDCLRAESALLPAASAAERLAALHAVRERVLGPEVAEAFYGDEEREAIETLARREAGRESALPRHEAETASLVAGHDARLDAIGADAATRHEERAARWGAEAAERLAALDVERARWRDRVEAYRRDAASIHADRQLDEGARSRALDALRAARFDPQERARVEALEAVGRLDASTYP